MKSKWIEFKKDKENISTVVDIWVEVKPSGYRGRVIDVYYHDGKWFDIDGEIDEVFQKSVTHFILPPSPPIHGRMNNGN